MDILKKIPHPLVRLRNVLNNHYTPPEPKIRDMAERRGFRLLDVARYEDLIKKAGVSASSIAKPAPDYRYYRVGLATHGDVVYSRVIEALEQMKVAYFKGASPDRWMATVNISLADYAIVASILSNWFGNDYRLGIETSDGYAKDIRSFFQSHKELNTTLKIVCCEKQGLQNGVYASIILLNFWEEKALYTDSSIFESGIANPYVKRLRGVTYEQLRDKRADISSLSTHLSNSVQFPVDAVYTWVDDQDEDWRRDREKFAISTGRRGQNRATHKERFKNRDELKYSLRSVELFAPFIRHIYLVTNGQVPSWLDTDNPRITVVSHGDIYRQPHYLPTFNSSGIETQLHRIKDLSDYFLYFNDDFFLGQFCTAEDYFYPNGILKYFPTEQRVYEDDIDETSEEYIIADANAINLMKEDYGAYNREIMMHVPYPSSRLLLSRMEESYSEAYARCAASRFRSSDDLRPIAFMQYHSAFQEKLAVPGSISHRYLALWKSDIDKQFANVLKYRKHKTFCINDVGVSEEKSEWTDSLVQSFLDQYYPLKSSFEK